jgi:hypothetical protein
MKAHSHEPMNRYEPRRMSRHYPSGVRLVLTGVSGKLGRIQTSTVGSLEYVKGQRTSRGSRTAKAGMMVRYEDRQI